MEYCSNWVFLLVCFLAFMTLLFFGLAYFFQNNKMLSITMVLTQATLLSILILFLVASTDMLSEVSKLWNDPNWKGLCYSNLK